MDVGIGDWAGDGSGRLPLLSAIGPAPCRPSTAIATDDAGNPQYTPAVAGSVGGTPFTLDDHAQVTFNSASTGTFRGTRRERLRRPHRNVQLQIAALRRPAEPARVIGPDGGWCGLRSTGHRRD